MNADGDEVTEIVFDETVTFIPDYAFNNCANLKSVTVSDSVTGIGTYAFANCTELSGLTIGSGTTHISCDAFTGCTGLSDIQISEDNSYYCIDEYGVVFSKDKTTLIMALGNISGVYVVPDSVTDISGYAFMDCTGLSGITMGDHVKNIGEYAFSGVPA